MAQLTNLQKLFIEHYLQTWNATEAARRAGYKGSANTLAVTGHDNLRKPNIKAAIDERMREEAMATDEALARVARQARGIDFSKLAEVFRMNAQEGVTLADIMERIHQLGIGDYIKRVKVDKSGLDIQLHDSQDALFKILQGSGVFMNHTREHTWEDDAVELIKRGEITYEAMLETFDNDHDKIHELFKRAGLPIPD